MNQAKKRSYIQIVSILVVSLGIIFAIQKSDFIEEKIIDPLGNKIFLADTLNGLAGIAAPGAVTPVVTTATTDKFGISLETKPYTYTDSQLNATFNDIASLGMGWVRFDLPWSLVQPTGPDSFDWTAVDRVVASANAHNIKLVPILDYTPGWARPDVCNASDKCGPLDPTAFANFAQAAAQRYSSQGIHTWEIWNEPNITQFWLPAPSTKNYSLLLKDSYTAIKTVDSSATVISAGLSPATTSNGDIAPTDFLSGLYKNGAGAYFDAVGMHPYSFPVPPSTFESWNAWSQMSATSVSLRSIMVANGDSSKKIWITEVGAPTGGPGVMATATNYQLGNSPDHVDEALQAKIIQDAITTVQTYSWAGPLFIYSYKDNGAAPTTIENFFGLLRYDGSPKPAYTVFKSLIAPAPTVPPVVAPTSTTTTPTSTTVTPTSTTTTTVTPTTTTTTTVTTTPTKVYSWRNQQSHTVPSRRH